MKTRRHAKRTKFVLHARKDSKNRYTDTTYGQKGRFISRREARQVVHRTLDNRKPLNTGNDYASSSSAFARTAKQAFKHKVTPRPY